MRKDREFNDVLNECLERLVEGGESVEQCLHSYPEQSTELEPLLRTAMNIRKAAAVEPRAEFKARARYQFHLALAELKPKRRLWEWEWRPRWVTAVAAVLVVLFAGSGMGIATYHSMPGQLLYPVRLTAEDVWLGRTPAGIARAEMHAGLAERRVAEIVYLAEREDNAAKIERVTERLGYHLATIESLAAAEEVVAVAQQKLAAEFDPVTKDVAPVVPPAAIVEAELHADAAQPEPPVGEDARERGVEAVRLTAGPVGLDAPAVVCPEEAARWAEFRLTLKEQAAGHLAELRHLLPVVSEEAKPALHAAIARLEAGYERAIEILE